MAAMEMIELDPKPQFFAAGEGSGGLGNVEKLLEVNQDEQETRSSWKPSRTMIWGSFGMFLAALVFLFSSLATYWYVPAFFELQIQGNTTCRTVIYQSWRSFEVDCFDCPPELCASTSGTWLSNCTLGLPFRPLDCPAQESAFTLTLALMSFSSIFCILTAVAIPWNALRRSGPFSVNSKLRYLIFASALLSPILCVIAYAFFAGAIPSALADGKPPLCDLSSGKSPCVQFKECTWLNTRLEMCWSPGTGWVLGVMASPLLFLGFILLIYGNYYGAIRRTCHDLVHSEDEELLRVQRLVLHNTTTAFDVLEMEKNKYLQDEDMERDFPDRKFHDESAFALCLSHSLAVPSRMPRKESDKQVRFADSTDV